MLPTMSCRWSADKLAKLSLDSASACTCARTSSATAGVTRTASEFGSPPYGGDRTAPAEVGSIISSPPYQRLPQRLSNLTDRPLGSVRRPASAAAAPLAA